MRTIKYIFLISAAAFILIVAFITGNAYAWSMDTDLSNANASFWGEDADDSAGSSVSGAGDVNGDGYDDILISAPQDEDGGNDAGQVYLILGTKTGWSMDTNLSNADASFLGEDAGDFAGSSVSGAGDVNNDGYDDILIGTCSNKDGGGDSAGQVYLILGKSTGWSMDTDLSSADASFWGEDASDHAGSSVSGAGDVNNDGYDDILIGASGNGDGGNSAGQVYLILGKSTGWSMDTDLSNADASFWGEDAYNHAGSPVSDAGDVNGDGYDDILIGASGNGDGGNRAGQVYLILGKSTGWSMDTDLSNADASFWGEDASDSAGSSVSGAGDVNNDGYDDILIGAYGSGKSGLQAGQVYLILGMKTGWTMDTDLSNADASFWGEDLHDYAVSSVSGAGDVNDDGCDDFLIGTHFSYGDIIQAGQVYLILGTKTGWTMDMNLSNSNASFWAEDSGYYAVWSVSGAGDINADDYDDILIGARWDDDGGDNAGQVYLIFGKNEDQTDEGIFFSTEEDFITHGPTPPDGNPIISDGDLLYTKDCSVFARNRELLLTFEMEMDLGLDTADVIDAEKPLIAFSTELDDPKDRFTAGDLLATNGIIIPNFALMAAFDDMSYVTDLGLDAVHFIGDNENIINFLKYIEEKGTYMWEEDPGGLSVILEEYDIDIWFSTEGTAPVLNKPLFLDGDLLSARYGTIIAQNNVLLPSSIPAGIPDRGVDFGLDALTAQRSGSRETILFSTEILYDENLYFTDGDILMINNGPVHINKDLIHCFEPKVNFLGLDALSIDFSE